MNQLAQKFFALSFDKRKKVHIQLAEFALTKWEMFYKATKPINYTDSIVGLNHTVDVSLPEDSIQAVKNGYDTKNIKKRYAEPIAAMQDDDLIFPKSIEFAYYGIYNLFNKYILNENIDDWLLINQCLSAFSIEEIDSIFEKALNLIE
jgi:hypothetical protein